MELAGVWFAQDKIRYTTGLLIGIALACGMAVHIAAGLQDTVGAEAGASSRFLVRKAILRYAVVVLVFVGTIHWNLGSLLSCFLGVFGLKVSAYLQPAAHKFFLKMQGEGICETPKEGEPKGEVKM